MHSSILLEEALSIPEKINHFIINDKNNYADVSKLINEKKIQYIVTVARGTSDCAALYASYMFAKYLGLPTYSMPPSIITLENSQFDFSKALVIIISQSGLSADLVECENKSKQMGATTILISNNQKSPMVNTSNFFYYINAGEEKSVAATKTFVLSLLIIQKIIFNTLNKNIDNHIKNISEQLIKNSNNQWETKIIDKSVNVGFIIGRGVGYAIANEISLKFKELCQEMIEPFSSAEVMHGPKSLIQNSFKVFTMSLKDNSGKIVYQDSKEIIKLTNLHYEISFEDKNKKNLFYNSYEFIELDPIIILSKFYPWIVKYSIEKGLDPDKPRYLTKVTKTF